ncbi:MAG TPA: crotonase/enoyl-CoA hydratase family protein [Alphaproteobacteria bacterium]|nr:crotonase/enoyl-CoA hydratase family protein [Alphaproteobacteria bacterium]
MSIVQNLFGSPARGRGQPEPTLRAPELHRDASAVPAHVEVANWRYENIDVELDPEARTFWCFMRTKERGSFTLELMQDIAHMQRSFPRLFAERAHEPEKPFEYFVFASRIPGTYNLGGDLGFFAERIRARDRAALSLYAHTAVRAIHKNHTAFDVPVVTMALVQGDALGGGFECALSLDMIVAERSAKMGLPEILFNLFPGMGAYSFLSRRLDAARAEKMILSGKIYSAEELHELGIVDVLADDGNGEEAVREYIDRHAYRHNAYRGVFQARRRVNPVPFDELRDVVDIWVEAALSLKEADLRKMERLTAAQNRRRAATAQPEPVVSALPAE